jgi:hypothetical protein
MTGTATRKKVRNANHSTQGELIIDIQKGMAYFPDKETIQYDTTYLDKIKTKTKKKVINKIRKELVDKLCPNGMILDVGCGDLSFINTIHRAYGYDIIPETVHNLGDKYRNPIERIPSDVKGLTFWDSLEHMPQPRLILDKVKDQTVFVSIPIIQDMRTVRQWTHYRPGEHLWYFTNNGFLDWMAKMGLMCIEHTEDETKAGREDIQSYVFRRI